MMASPQWHGLKMGTKLLCFNATAFALPCMKTKIVFGFLSSSMPIILLLWVAFFDHEQTLEVVVSKEFINIYT